MAALIPLILQGLAVLPGILAAFKTVFGKSTATSQQKVDIVSGVAGTVLGIVGGVSTGGQAKTMQMAQAALPHVQQLTDSLMNLAELSGKTGEQKQAFVNSALTNALHTWELLSTGGQARTVEEVKVVATPIIDAFVPVLFPKDNIENLQPSN